MVLILLCTPRSDPKLALKTSVFKISDKKAVEALLVLFKKKQTQHEIRIKTPKEI
jgi:hypothetical protein